jgi:hypothetical protein
MRSFRYIPEDIALTIKDACMYVTFTADECKLVASTIADECHHEA